MTETAKKRPEFRNINAFKDLTTYRMTAAAWTSILHRASGAVMFLLLPLVIWFFDTSVSSEVSFERFTSAFSSGLGIVPGWLLKLVSLGLIWGYLHHMFAGIRHLIMDIDHHAVNNQFGKTSGLTAIGLAIVLTLLLGVRLFGLY
ncbi:MAG: succinate dehydrogenase, cytochrome b556 subunit [Simplicispira suum]|uniref:succinate dehydrogenase, cytochrome b556 subunit n=1 Tax=Simplicispira suum TaxID=2109915 RepID=UPI001C6A9AFE|nr:succinate dehydrogenase, cytochrome b556 subunit [Simplicispira suum]MBW7834146.1 succinate dehydrogenase, cytochrome b556 subunit [Simplicispira suum]